MPSLLTKIFSILKARSYLSALLIFLFLFEASYLIFLNKKISTYDIIENYIPYQILVHYKANIKNQYNDVVFVGDSSCLEGVKPKIIEEKTGLKAVNLALYGFTGPQGYDAILRNYLKNNPPPKLIIYYFSPAMPNIYKTKTFEKTYVCMKYFNIKTFLSHYDMINPLLDFAVLLDYVKKFYKTNKNVFQYLKTLEDEKGYDSSNGLGRGCEASCRVNSQHIYTEIIGTKEDPLYYLEKFKNDFTTRDTKVLFYLAPMLEGEDSFQYFVGIYEKIVDNFPYKLPNKYFRDYTHLIVEGADVNSKIVAEFLAGSVKNAL